MTRGSLSEQILRGQPIEMTPRQRDVIRVAAEMFDRRGYHETSMDDIAGAVGIRKPTLYHHFDGKAEILFCIHHEIIELLISKQLLHEGLSPSDRLRETVRDVIQLVSDHRSALRVFHQHYRQLPGDLRAAVRTRRMDYQVLVEDVVKAGIESGELRRVDPTIATLGILGMGHWANRWYRPESGRSPDDVAGELFEIVARGVFQQDDLRMVSPRQAS